MRPTLIPHLCALLTLPLGSALAQEAPAETPAVPLRVIRLAQPEPLQAAQEPASGRGQIGIYLGAAKAEAGAGAVVGGLVTGGAAEGAGLQAGDRILAIDEQRVADAAELVEAVKARSAGDSVSLLVERDGWRKRIELRLGAAQAEQPERLEWTEVEEVEEHVEQDEPSELGELRRLIEIHTEHEGGMQVERRLWIDGEEVSPERIEELERELETGEEEAPSWGFFFSEEDHEHAGEHGKHHEHHDEHHGHSEEGGGALRWEHREPAPIRVRVERGQYRESVERRRLEQRERRMLRAERMRAMEEQRRAERMRAMEDQRQRRELQQRSEPQADRARAELHALREELAALRGEVEALRRELAERRGR